MLNQASRNVINYNAAHSDFPMQQDQLERYIPKALVYALLWSFAGACPLLLLRETMVVVLHLPLNTKY